MEGTNRKIELHCVEYSGEETEYKPILPPGNDWYSERYSDRFGITFDNNGLIGEEQRKTFEKCNNIHLMYSTMEEQDNLLWGNELDFTPDDICTADSFENSLIDIKDETSSITVGILSTDTIMDMKYYGVQQIDLITGVDIKDYITTRVNKASLLGNGQLGKDILLQLLTLVQTDVTRGSEYPVLMLIWKGRAKIITPAKEVFILVSSMSGHLSRNVKLNGKCTALDRFVYTKNLNKLLEFCNEEKVFFIKRDIHGRFPTSTIYNTTRVTIKDDDLDNRSEEAVNRIKEKRLKKLYELMNKYSDLFTYEAHSTDNDYVATDGHFGKHDTDYFIFRLKQDVDEKRVRLLLNGLWK